MEDIFIQVGVLLLSFLLLLFLLSAFGFIEFPHLEKKETDDKTVENDELELKLEVGDIIFEKFEIISITHHASETYSITSYEVIDTNSRVVYLCNFQNEGDGKTLAMTPLYNADGTLRTHPAN